jgi:hypothetical protein
MRASLCFIFGFVVAHMNNSKDDDTHQIGLVSHPQLDELRQHSLPEGGKYASAPPTSNIVEPPKAPAKAEEHPVKFLFGGGSFRLTQTVIGRGSFATVYLGTDTVSLCVNISKAHVNSCT